MKKDDLLSLLNKRITIFLRNNFRYDCRVRAIREIGANIFIEIDDFRGKTIRLINVSEITNLTLSDGGIHDDQKTL